MKFFGQKKSRQGKKQSSEARGYPPHTLFALLRRLERRVTELEARQGNDRRDINRIERKYGRQAESEALPTPQPLGYPREEAPVTVLDEYWR